jgi:tetratricopeptide (TPR) repeat protein
VKLTLRSNQLETAAIWFPYFLVRSRTMRHLRKPIHFRPLILAAALGSFAGGTFAQGQPGPGDQPVLAPAKPGLQPVPLPSLDRLESSVAEQIRSVQQSLVDRFAKGEIADDNLAEAYGALGQLYHAYELTGSAEPCYRNAGQLAPQDHRWRHLLGYLYQQTGQLQESARSYQAVREMQPDYVAAAARLGDVYLQLSRPDEARKEFEAALKTDPNLAAGHKGLGEVALAQREHAEAVQHLSAALERVPAANRLHYSLAMAYRGMGNMEKAREHLERRGTVGIRPVDPLVDALEDLVQGERLYLIRGHLAFGAGRYQEAAKAFENAVKAKPDSARGRVNLGTSLAKLGDQEGAIKQFRAALQHDPDQRIAHFNLAALMLQDNRFTEAEKHFREVLRIAPNDAEATHELAKLLLKTHRADAALDCLFRAAKLRPDDEPILLDLAALLVRKGRYQEARDRLNRAHLRFPELGLTASALARLLAACPDASLRRGKQALDLAQRCYRDGGAFADAETVALALAEVGRCDEAAAWQNRLVAAAEKSGNRILISRLKRDLRRYEAGSPCRPPKQDLP